MECRKCQGRLKRVRTIDKGESVIRYNRCTSCGAHNKTIEIDLAEFDAGHTEQLERLIAAERKGEQLAFRLDTISEAFQTIHDALRPIQEAKDRDKQGSSFAARYTRDFQQRRR